MTAASLIAQAANLRAPSATVVRLLHMLNDAEADYREVIRTVSHDTVLSAKLLALCNSASYGLAAPVPSVEQAVHYLGYWEIHRLVMALNFGAQIGVELPGYGMEAGALWRHSLVTALITPRVASLARKFGVETSIAYTAGLLHDIGKIVISQLLDEESRGRIRHLVDVCGQPMREAERAVLGCDHCEIGATLLRQWRIPEVLVEAVASHHAAPARGVAAQLASAVHVADALAHQSGASPGWESFAIVVHEESLDALGLRPEDLDLLSLAAADAHDELAEQLGETATRRAVVPPVSMVF